jgi:spore coat protein A
MIMKFTVRGNAGYIPPILPQILNPTMANGSDLDLNTSQRNFTLVDYVGQLGTSMALLDGQLYKAPITENPKVGTTELWTITDATANSHLIHIDLVSLQIVSRQRIDIKDYKSDWLAENGGSLPFTNKTINIDIEKYLLGDPVGPTPIESGMKDSIKVDPGEVVTILVSPQPTIGPHTLSTLPAGQHIFGIAIYLTMKRTR